MIIGLGLGLGIPRAAGLPVDHGHHQQGVHLVAPGLPVDMPLFIQNSWGRL